MPVNKRVRIVEVSKDVIHSFWVPEFLFKRDVIPMPKPNRFEITATQTGSSSDVAPNCAGPTTRR